MTASFFSNATNVNISGGEFNVVKGNYNVFDQSRHTSNVGSFNTTNNTTVGSHNDNSQQHYRGRGRLPPNLPRPDASRSNGAPSEAPYPNGQYFPPPAVHPALTGGTTNLPPGSTMDNFNSMNTTQMTVDQAYNDNSRAYNMPISASPRDRNPNVGPQANPYQQQYAPYAQSSAQNRHGNFSPTTSAYNERGMPNASPGTGGQTSPRGGQYAQDPNAFPRYGRGGMAGQYVSGAYGRRSGNVANFAPGDVQSLTPAMEQALNTLMKGAVKMTAPEPAAAVQPRGPSSQEMEEDSDSDGTSSDDEDSRGSTDPQRLRHGMAKLSLVDASAHPTYSRVKSDSQFPLRTNESISEVMNRNIPVHTESAEEVPQHMKEGVIMGQAPPFFPGAHPPQSYSRPPQATSPSSSASSSSTLAQFGLDNKPDAIQGPAVFNTYHGGLNKYDNSHHITNIDSGNTHNNLVKDSYNDNSIQSYAASPQSEPARQGKKGPWFRR
ncbi:hypothetical protein BJ912DRAFT_959323 [Pholiota molesta]|nr:hypothetical protein BJ912DRAFT_959323 [Pholiota molesta]